MPSARRGDRIVVTCAKRSFRLRSATALEWISGSLSPDMSGLFPGLVASRDAELVFDLWTTVPDMQRRCVNVSRVALGRSSGREWFWTYNLIKECVASWPYLNGMLIRQGVHADRENLSDWIDAAYTLLRELLDEKERKALDIRLRQIPRGLQVKAKAIMSTRAELMAFASD